MGQLEVGELLQKAKDASIKVVTQQEVTTTDLESIFKVVNYNQNQLWENLSSVSMGALMDTLVLSIESAADSIVDYIVGELTNNKDIGEIFTNDVLNDGDTIRTFLSDPNSLLPAELKLSDTEAVKALNDKIIDKIEEKLKSMGQDYFNNLDTDKLETIANKLEKISYLDDDLKDNIKFLVSGALFSKISPALEEYSNKFSDAIKKAISDADATFDAKKWKSDFMDLVREIEEKSITRGSASEKYMEDCKKKFETVFDNSLTTLIKNIVDTVVVKELDECETIEEIKDYTTANGTYKNIKKNWIPSLFDDEKKADANDFIDGKVASAEITIKSRPPRVKVYTDSEGNQYAKFKNEAVPVARHEKVEHNWKIEPKMLANGNVVLTFKDISSGRVLEPNMAKRLRLDYPYEMTLEDRKNIQKEIKTYNKKQKEIEEIKLKIKETNDKEEKKKLVKQLISMTPYFYRVLEKLHIFDGFLGDYIEDKIPGFDEERIKITPDIMEYLREIAECAKTMLKSQHDILILEGEAGVGKNIIFDIFAHFTNRPVFVFSCGKKTDVQDLTYIWILDENGSKKLNSKIYEAIHTPGAILVLDEINTLDPGIQKRLNGLLDPRKSLIVDEAGEQREHADPSVLIFGTMNPQGYSGTQPLAQDVRSRAHFIYYDYDWLLKRKDGGFEVSYSDALKTYGNVKYFWKLAARNGFTKDDIKLYEEAILDELHGNRLSPEKKRILRNFKPISDSDFIWAWNNLFNGGSESEVINRFGNTFVSGMKDIYTMMLYANYIRMRYKATKEGWDDNGLPRYEDTNEFFDDISFSPRLAIQALEQLHNGGLTAKEAVIQTFVGQLTDVNNRPKVIEFFNTLSENNIISQLTNGKVIKHLS